MSDIETLNTDPQNPETTKAGLTGSQLSVCQLFHSQQKRPFLLSPTFSETDETLDQLGEEIESEKLTCGSHNSSKFK